MSKALEFTTPEGALDLHKLFDTLYELKKKRDKEPPEPFLTIPIRWYRLADVGALKQLRCEIDERELGEEWASDIYHHVVAGIPYRQMLREYADASRFVAMSAAKLRPIDARVTPKSLEEALR